LKQSKIVVTDSAQRQFEEFLGKGLDEFNLQAAGLTDRRPLCVMVRDPDSDEVVGGIVGRMAG
jgi:hypothetical protein